MQEINHKKKGTKQRELWGREHVHLLVLWYQNLHDQMIKHFSENIPFSACQLSFSVLRIPSFSLSSPRFLIPLTLLPFQILRLHDRRSGRGGGRRIERTRGERKRWKEGKKSKRRVYRWQTVVYLAAFASSLAKRAASFCSAFASFLAALSVALRYFLSCSRRIQMAFRMIFPTLSGSFAEHSR